MLSPSLSFALATGLRGKRLWEPDTHFPDARRQLMCWENCTQQVLEFGPHLWTLPTRFFQHSALRSMNQILSLLLLLFSGKGSDRWHDSAKISGKGYATPPPSNFWSWALCLIPSQKSMQVQTKSVVKLLQRLPRTQSWKLIAWLQLR